MALTLDLDLDVDVDLDADLEDAGDVEDDGATLSLPSVCNSVGGGGLTLSSFRFALLVAAGYSRRQCFLPAGVALTSQLVLF